MVERIGTKVEENGTGRGNRYRISPLSDRQGLNHAALNGGEADPAAYDGKKRDCKGRCVPNVSTLVARHDLNHVADWARRLIQPRKMERNGTTVDTSGTHPKCFCQNVNSPSHRLQAAEKLTTVHHRNSIPAMIVFAKHFLFQ